MTHRFSFVVSTTDLGGDSADSVCSGEKSGFFRGALMLFKDSFSSDTIYRRLETQIPHLNKQEVNAFVETK